MAMFERRVSGYLAVAGLGAALAAAPALAQPAATASSTPTAPIVVQGGKTASQPASAPSAIDQADPLICEKIHEIGSRLKVKKVCLTKSQWDAQKREDRMNIERSQVTRGVGPG